MEASIVPLDELGMFGEEWWKEDPALKLRIDSAEGKTQVVEVVKEAQEEKSLEERAVGHIHALAFVGSLEVVGEDQFP
jgi:hypothetical protein